MASPDVDVELVRRGGLERFVKMAWRHVPQEYGDPIFEPHMKLMCAHYEAVSRGEIRDLVVNVPPGHSKSVITNVLWPAWDWIANPWRKWIFTSYSEELALRDAGRCMDLMMSEWYRARWGGLFDIVSGDKAAKRYYGNNKGGSRFSTSMNGAVTGFHAHFLVCDDPIKPKDIQAGGDPAREALEKCNTTYDQTFSSRRADSKTFAKITIMQRLHALDLAGVMLKRGAVGLILPMEYEPHRHFKSQWGEDWRKEPGELLAPLRFPQEVVDADKQKLSIRDWAAQYQQRPSPEDGAIFMREFFAKRWIALPRMSKMVLSVDATFKEKKKSDFFVVQCWGLKTATEYYLLDQQKQRTGFWGGLEMIKNMRKKWPQVGTVLVEDKANGSAIIETLQKSMTGVLALNPRGGKESRANAAEPIYRTNITFPDRSVAPWVEEFIASHLEFPVGEYDDEIDCATQAVLWLQSKSGYAMLGKAMENVRRGTAKLY